MKKIITLSFLTLCLSCLSHRAAAQWNIVSELLSQMDSSEFSQFYNNLDSLQDIVAQYDNDFVNNNDNANEFGTDGLLDSLDNVLQGSNPAGELDSLVFNVALDSLANFLDGSPFLSFDEDTILGQANELDGIFDSNFDSLANVYAEYQDSLDFDPDNEVNISILENTINGNLASLQDSFNLLEDDINVAQGGPGHFANLLGMLLDETMFRSFEIAFGVQNSTNNYYLKNYNASAKVIRIGTVPTLTSLMESRWHLQGSWVDGDVLLGDGSDSGVTPNNPNNQYTPLLFKGDFAVMLNPGLATIGGTSFRLLTSLGLEAGTYAPSHSDYRPGSTFYNQGYATGWGPQAGAGFSFASGPLTVYTLGTIAYGDLAHCNMPTYRYRSFNYEAGVRYGNFINVRYSKGYQSWQPYDNRTAEVKNQVTIGIVLSSLDTTP